MKAYVIYNFRGQNESLSAIPLNDEIMDEINITPADGFRFLEDAYGIPYVEHVKTRVPYSLSDAWRDNGQILAKMQTVNKLGRLETTDKFVTLATISE